tara:strand:- start:851 stop:1294 length:444 start_codon:yes stop_codon:yes gene_type:complete
LHSKDELTLFLGNEELAESARLMELIGTWSSIKILNYLYQKNMTISTANLSRELHFDIDNTRKILEALEKYRFVELQIAKDGTNLWLAKSPKKISLIIDKSGIQSNVEELSNTHNVAIRKEADIDDETNPSSEDKEKKKTEDEGGFN